MNKTATYSTLFTVSAALGFLCSAIMTDNGSALVKLGSDVIAVDKSKLGIEYSGKSVEVSSVNETKILDRIITGAIKRPSMDQQTREEVTKPKAAEVSTTQKSPVLKEISEQKSVLVAPGDTLYKIARANNLTVDELASINNLTDPYLLRVGQELVVAR